MKNRFKELRNYADDLSIGELFDECVKLASEIARTDNSLLSISKKWVSYGTWKSTGFANEYHFGDELSGLLTKVLSSKVTHDEDKEFHVSEFENEIFEIIFENI